jgi:hypothetical protein
MKLKTIIRSRKFWVLVASLVAVAAGYFQGQIDMWQAIQSAVGAGAAYSVATGIESGLHQIG